MNFEQILIRLGLDSKAVTSGLTRVGSYVRGWGMSLMHDLQHSVMGRFVGIYLFEHLIESVKEKALTIHRLMHETGQSSNMIQGMMAKLADVGEGFEVLTKPLAKFAVLIGQAKQGSVEARAKLIHWGIATKETNWATLNATTGIKNLAVAYDKLGSQEEKAALLQSIYGKGWIAIAPVFERGAKAVADMDKGNVFTKLTPAAIEFATAMNKGWESFKRIGMATVGNLLAYTVGDYVRGVAVSVKAVHDRERFAKMSTMERIKYFQQAAKFILIGANSEQQEKIDSLRKEQELLKGNLDVLKESNEAHKLENQLTDRTKTTVGALADRYAEIVGKGRPRGLKSIYSITPAMAAAKRIQDLELDAEAANARGDFGKASSLQSQADQMRKNNFSLKSTERDPTLEIRQHLEIIIEDLERKGIKISQMPEVH